MPQPPSEESGPGTSRLDLEMVIPLRWDHPASDPAHQLATAELCCYLRWAATRCDVTVVDGSAPEAYGMHARRWAAYARICRPEPRPGLNGKVVGSLTGIELARHDLVVLADDDVRYDDRSLEELHAVLQDADLVRPQNVFDRWPWHARWDMGRSLLNRAVAADWPGTFGLRRSTVLAMGGWDADVLFENLELLRTVRAHAGRVVNAPWLVVCRKPPSVRQFWGQRVRQAYDDFAQPGRLLVSLLLLPAAALAAGVSGKLATTGAVVAAVAVVATAEVGRRRPGTADRVPVSCDVWALAWVLERAVCSWLAVGQRRRGGARYRGGRLLVAAHSERALRRLARGSTAAEGQRR